MPSEKYEFKSYHGDVLAGRLELPDGDIEAFAIFAHCFTCTKDFVASRSIAQSLAKRGIATLRFDFTGLGNSAGDFANTHFSSNVKDLLMAARSLSETHDSPKLMVGHSLGGAAVLAAASHIDSIRAVATIAAPYDPAHVTHLFAEDLNTIEENGHAHVDLFGRKFTISKDFVDDIHQQNPKNNISAMKCALLVMHSPTDNLVSIENAKLIYDAAQHPKSFIGLDGMDHLLMNPDDVDYVADILSSWSARYITMEY